MYIKSIHIGAFGSLRDKDIIFGKGLNIIEGKNEAGKSTLAMFIKFTLYGLSGRSSDGELPERRRFVSWDTGSAEGSMTVVCSSGEYRIERELYVSGDGSGVGDAVRERVSVIDTATGEKVFRGMIPGVALLGIPEDVFVNTVFVKQSGGKIDGDGLVEAIENILLSGDESVSTKKAADKLDKCRKTLRYKKGSGGLLYELEREEARLMSRLGEAQRNNADIIAMECSVGELQKTVEERTAESEHCGALMDAYEKIQRKRRLDEAAEYKRQLDAVDERLAEFEKYGNIADKTRNIHRLSGEADLAEGRIAEIRRRLDTLDHTLPPEMSDAEVSELRGRVEGAKRCKSTSGVLRGLGIAALVLGAAAAALPFLISFGSMIKYALWGGGAAAAVLGIVFLIVSAVKAGKYKAVLSEWGAQNTDRLTDITEAYISDASSRQDPQSEYGMTKRALEKASAERWSVLEELRELCFVFCDESSDTDELVQNALNAAESASAELEGLRSKKRETAARYEMVSSSVGSTAADIEDAWREIAETDIGREAMTLNAAAASQLASKKRFADGSLPALNRTLTDRESGLRALRATTANPAALAAELDGIRRDKEKNERRYDAVVCALEALQNAGESLRHSLMPRIVSEAGAAMADFSGGRYNRLGASRSFEISFESDGKTRDGAYFSAGTADMAYISLRCALLRVLFSADVPPTVYDESFARIDEERLYRILSVLDGTAGTQSLVFTCRSLERDIAKRLENVNVISLDK